MGVTVASKQTRRLHFFRDSVCGWAPSDDNFEVEKNFNENLNTGCESTTWSCVSHLVLTHLNQPPPGNEGRSPIPPPGLLTRTQSPADTGRTTAWSCRYRDSRVRISVWRIRGSEGRQITDERRSSHLIDNRVSLFGCRRHKGRSPDPILSPRTHRPVLADALSSQGLSCLSHLRNSPYVSLALGAGLVVPRKKLGG